MTDRLYYKLWKDALNQPDRELYLNEYGYPEWFDEISGSPEGVMDALGKIHDTVWMPFGEIVRRSGLTQQAFSEKFCIPLRTIEHWMAGDRKPPEWAKKLIIEKL